MNEIPYIYALMRCMFNCHHPHSEPFCIDGCGERTGLEWGGIHAIRVNRRDTWEVKWDRAYEFYSDGDIYVRKN